MGSEAREASKSWNSTATPLSHGSLREPHYNPESNGTSDNYSPKYAEHELAVLFVQFGIYFENHC